MRYSILALLLIGCTSPPGGSSESVPLCVENRDCPDDLSCSGGACVEVACPLPTDCGPDRACVFGRCVRPPADYCEADEDCPGGSCDLANRRCLLGVAGCGDGGMCEDGLVCELGRCVAPACEDDSGCGGGRYCADDGTCQRGCRLEGDCPVGLVCDRQSRQCRPADSCDDDLDCVGNEYCLEGDCVLGCRTDPDNCDEGRACDAESRRCVDVPCEGDDCADAGVEPDQGVPPDAGEPQADAGPPADAGEEPPADAGDEQPPDAVIACQGDNGCAAGSRCEGGVCVDGCRPDPDSCPPGFTCDAESGDCRCQDDAACFEGQYCNAEGACAQGCRLDPDSCAVGSCDPETRRCLTPACERDADCAEDQACGIVAADVGFELRCQPANADGRAEAECATGLDCASRTCVDRSFCFSACLADEDCPSGRCVGFAVEGQDPEDRTEFLTCERPPVLCEADVMCEEGRACLPVEPTPEQPNRVRLSCVADPPRANTGEACQADNQCDSGNCLPEGVCWGPCRSGQAGDCPDGQACYANIIHFVFDQDTPNDESDDRFWGMAGCTPDQGSNAACNDGRCPAGEGCRIVVNQGFDGGDLRCRTSPGASAGGALCNDDNQCQSGVCLNNGFCLGICDPRNPAGQCAAGSVCGGGTFTIWDRGTPNNPADDITQDFSVCVR